MKYRIAVALLALLLPLGGTVSKVISQGADSSFTFYDSLYLDDLPEETFSDVKTEYVPFGEGERLVFSVQYGLVTAGDATLEIRNLAEIDSVTCYRIVSDARTNSFFSAFFKVRDRFESYMDTTALNSKRYEKHIREGKFKRDEAVDFDQTAHTATYKDKVVPIAPMTQDVLSAMYYTRTLPLEVGQSISMASHTDGKNYPIVVKVHRKETVTVDAGTFDCLVIEPILRRSRHLHAEGPIDSVGGRMIDIECQY